MLDVVVIGLGGVGSFCLRSLSKRGLKVVGLERYHRIHDRGSSHGGSRIYRKAYFEGPWYVPWIQYSEQIFRELYSKKNDEDKIRSNKDDDGVLVNCGTLIMEEDGGPLIRACQESAHQWDIPVELYNHDELLYRYPQFRLSSDDTTSTTVKKLRGIFEPGGGFIRPEKAMQIALEDAELSDTVEIWENVKVTKIQEISDENYVEIHVQSNNDDMALKAKGVIVACGAWTSSLIPSWRSYLTPTRQIQGWIDVGESSMNSDAYLPQNFPTWCMSIPSRHPIMLYGTPRDPASTLHPGYIKIGLHGRPDILVDPSMSSPVVTQAEQQELIEATRLSLHCEPNIALAKPCLYTMSPDTHFVLGKPMEYNHVVAVSGLSGHGFKMTPALGEILCDMVLGQDYSKWNVKSILSDRFHVKN